MKCQDCGLPHKTSSPSLEFEVVLCDLCYGHRLTAKEREHTLSAAAAASRAHYKPRE